MNIEGLIITVLGLCLFKIISSINNVVINTGILVTIGKKAHRWFVLYGLFFAVFIIILLTLITMGTTMPLLGPVESFNTEFSADSLGIEILSYIFLLLTFTISYFDVESINKNKMDLAL